MSSKERMLVLASLVVAACSPVDGPPAPRAERDADPLALPLAAATRAWVRGELDTSGEEERSRFPHVERFPWRQGPVELSEEDLDRAWWAALERIAVNAAYADLRERDATALDPAPFSEERLQELERYLGFARDGRLVPLGADPDTTPSGLEEFAVVGTGEIQLRHPATGELEIEAGGAMILVLVPGGSYTPGSSSSAPSSKLAPGPATVRTFLLAKTEAIDRQLPDASSDGGAELPIVGLSWRDARDRVTSLGLRLPTEIEWEHAARGGGSAGIEGVPDAFGLLDMLGSVGEYCDGEVAIGGSSVQQISNQPSRVSRIVRGGDGGVGSPGGRLEARQLVSEYEIAPGVGLRAARDVIPPDPSPPEEQSAPPQMK